MTYDPLEFSITMAMLLNNDVIFKNSISGKFQEKQYYKIYHLSVSKIYL